MTAKGGIFFPSASELIIDRKEAMRYLGITEDKADVTTLVLLDEYEKKLRQVITPRYCASVYPIGHTEDGYITVGTLRAKSRALSINLADSTHALLFAATVGAKADMLIRTASARSSAEGVICDALASAAVEAVCDIANRELTRGYIPRPRFSIGYGDLQLELQSAVLDMLAAQKSIGIYTTNSNMLVPSKSVTAMIGIKDIPERTI